MGIAVFPRVHHGCRMPTGAPGIMSVHTSAQTQMQRAVLAGAQGARGSLLLSLRPESCLMD